MVSCLEAFNRCHGAGPVIRINADELHISDPMFYDQIYASSRRKIDKWAPMTASYTIPESSVATVDHDLHRLRRGILSPYFSRSSISKMEPIITERIDRLCSRLDEYSHRDEVVSLDSAFSALTTDIITQYFFGPHDDNLGRPDFIHPLQEAILGLTGAFQFTRLFPKVATAVKALLLWVISLFQPKMACLLSWKAALLCNIEASLNTERADARTESVILTAFQDLNTPLEQKAIARLVDEGMLFLIAGSETTARVLSRIMFQLLMDKDLLRRLRIELSTLLKVPDHLQSAAKLERLPLLVRRSLALEMIIADADLLATVDSRDTGRRAIVTRSAYSAASSSTTRITPVWESKDSTRSKPRIQDAR